MPPDENIPGTPSDWLRRAQSNLILAKEGKTEGVLWADLCFEAQQAAEKAIKAVLLFNNIKFRYVHDLAELITLLQNNNISTGEKITESAILTEYAVMARYPGATKNLTEDDYREAVNIAENIFNWAQNQIDS